MTETMTHSMQSHSTTDLKPQLHLEVCESILVTAMALLPRALARHDQTHRSTLSSILNVLHPRLHAPLLLDAALHTAWWFSIDTATVGGTCLRLDLLGRAIRLRGLRQTRPDDSPSLRLPIATHPSHFNLTRPGNSAEETIALLDFWFHPDTPTTWVPSFHGLVQAGLASHGRWRTSSHVAVDKWKHAAAILEWWVKTRRLNVADEAEMKQAQWMVMDFGNAKTIEVWRKVYEVEMGKFSANERESLPASVACVLAVDDVGAVQYCLERQVECTVHKRAVWNACTTGNVKALDWFASLCPSDSRPLDGVHCGIKMAAQVGHVSVLEWMHKNGYLDLDSEYQAGQVFNIAAEHAHMDVLEWLWIHADSPASVFQLEASVAHCIASIPVLNWLRDKALFENLDTSPHDSDHPCNGFTNAAAQGKLDVMQWWTSCAPECVRLTRDSEKAHCLLHIMRQNRACEEAFQWCNDHGFWQAYLNDCRHSGFPYLPLVDYFVHSSSIPILAVCSRMLEQAPGGFSEVVGHVLVQACTCVEALQWWIDSGYRFALAPHIFVQASVPVLELAQTYGLVHVSSRGMTGYAWQAVESAVFNGDVDRLAWWIRHLAAIGIPLTKLKLESYLGTAARTLNMCMARWLRLHCSHVLNGGGATGMVQNDRDPEWDRAWQKKK
ncbi:hypothetical protein BCR44DRAFT_281410 [Catenaria anguillulae PL171]|uniref:Ankyrin repeat-containing domain protein n=1 Tax=Catenaria anguillulae PL171 TaxID=765915 RepID=A0A1Y2HNF2_9FUNG|nr:hypothetical protein BCR44DRAFT_281410 [Catenaria anguillulae PL171]